MEQKLKDYVYSLFTNAPQTGRMVEVRDEICANVLERYRDLTASGVSSEEAYESAKRSVGDVSEIIRSLNEEPWRPSADAAEMQKKKSLYISLGVAMYILSPIFLIVFSVADLPIVGLICLFALVAAATGFCVYASNMYKISAPDISSVMSPEEAEDFQRWRAERVSGRRRQEAYHKVLWPLIVAAYFLVSFLSGAWYITWIIFIIGAAIQGIMDIALAGN